METNKHQIYFFAARDHCFFFNLCMSYLCIMNISLATVLQFHDQFIHMEIEIADV
jgi:hypothetical protein